jgi:hypothetical protein
MIVQFRKLSQRTRPCKKKKESKIKYIFHFGPFLQLRVTPDFFSKISVPQAQKG